eukprot:TRINITY_DN74726_c0_g1_i1.p1 TRINITY_DN74726_c0_g1~~TRINITY_DN74726_c0_g1_i1.p1  ORF type:complete len:1815 (+),score=457.75 TRINITY_DN74726_c0_g1_i1:569-5446(+)
MAGLRLLGAALCQLQESSLVNAMKRLKSVFAVCGAHARSGQGVDFNAFAAQVESVRAGIFQRLLALAEKQDRSLRVADFKGMVQDFGSILSNVYETTQVFELGSLLSLQLTLPLSAHSAGVPEEDAADALAWMTAVMKSLLDQGSTAGGTLSSPAGLKEWVDDNQLWLFVLARGSGRTQRRLSQLFTLLLTRQVISPQELVASLQEAGALSQSPVPGSTRCAVQSELATAVAASGMADVFSQVLCAAFGFEILDQESVDLLVRAVQSCLASSITAGSGPTATGHVKRIVTHMFQYLRWAVHIEDAEVQRVALHIRQELVHALAPQLAVAAALPALSAEALALALGPPGDVPPSKARQSFNVLLDIALSFSRTGAAAIRHRSEQTVSQLTAAAVAELCKAMPSVGDEVYVDQSDAQVWITTLVDVLGCYLRLPGAQIDTQQVGTLWSRMIVRPVFGLSVTTVAMQYFKLALVAQAKASSALLAPLQLAHSPTPEVNLAYTSIFLPVTFDDDVKPPLPAAFFLPGLDRAPAAAPAGAATEQVAETLTAALHPLRADSSGGAGGALELAAADAGLRLPPISTTAPRLRLDQIQACAGQNIMLFGELTGYEVVERRLWDEFDAQGRVEDEEVMRQRDNAGRRCLKALEREEQALAAVGRTLPRPLAEAKEKFSKLCDHVQAASSGRLASEVVKWEDAMAKAEREFFKAREKFDKASVRARRCGPAGASGTNAMLLADEAAAELRDWRAAYRSANIQLVATVRMIAEAAQLGLVEALGVQGLGRALRAVGGGHGDPLLDRVVNHRSWTAAQEGEGDLPDDFDEESSAAHMPKSPPMRTIAKDGPAVQPAAPQQHESRTGKTFLQASSPSKPASDKLPGADVLAEAMARLKRRSSLDEYQDVTELPASVSKSRRVLSARRGGTQVALKVWSAQEAALCQRELNALLTLQEESCVVGLQALMEYRGATYLELTWCGGGTFEQWCELHPGVAGTAEVEATVKCLAICRQLLQALSYVHGCGAVHGDVSLGNVLLTAEHRPVLADFKRASLLTSGTPAGGALPAATNGYVPPELESSGGTGEPTAAGDVYAAGVSMAKAFLGLQLEVSRCPYDSRSKQRALPDDRVDSDVLDLLQLALAQEPASRPSASEAAMHRALEPLQLLRRRGLLPATAAPGTRGRLAAAAAPPSEALLQIADRLREEFKGRRVDEPMMFARNEVFMSLAKSRINEWPEDALLGEWRVLLNDEVGVDGGGIRREIMSLFFEQFEKSQLVRREGADLDNPGVQPTLFVDKRQEAGMSPQEWRQVWSSVGAMVLRAVVHFGNAPVLFSSIVFDCAFGRLVRLPPDDAADDDDDSLQGRVDRLGKERQSRGDDWARSELLDWLKRLRQTDRVKEESYRWLLAQRELEPSHPASSSSSSTVSGKRYRFPSDSLMTIEAMLEPLPFEFLRRHSHEGPDGAFTHSGAVYEWTLLWDVYLKYIGSDDRWVAYEAFAAGLTARGRRWDLWSPLTGEQAVAALEGVPLTPEVVIANLEFKPSYGYDVQIRFFCDVLQDFTAEELSMFLRYATGTARIPANRRYPNGQKLTIRFMPDHLDRLPSAHTCFWVVDVPPYESVDDMMVKLRQAIAAPQPFYLS